MQKPNIGLTMFPLLIPKAAINSSSFQSDNDVEASPFFVSRMSLDGISKKLIVQITQAETGRESTLEIPPGHHQNLVYKALELAQLTHTPILLAVDTEEMSPRSRMAA